MQAYFEYMMDVAVLLGANPAAAEKEMTEVLLFEIAIANISLPRYTPEQFAVDDGCQLLSLPGYCDNKDLNFTFIWTIYVSTLIKMKIKFSSYIGKFRVEQLQSHI